MSSLVPNSVVEKSWHLPRLALDLCVSTMAGTMLGEALPNKVTIGAFDDTNVSKGSYRLSRAVST
jgi:hypothetical protein